MAPKTKPAPAEAEPEAKPRTRTMRPRTRAAIDYANAMDSLAAIAIRQKKLREELTELDKAREAAVLAAEQTREALDEGAEAAGVRPYNKGAKPARRARKGQPDDAPAPAPARRTPKPGSDEEE